MLANSLPLPLIIDYYFDDDVMIATEDEEGFILALWEHHDRVCHIRLKNRIPNLQKLIGTLDGEFPILQQLFVYHSYPTVLYHPFLLTLKLKARK